MIRKGLVLGAAALAICIGSLSSDIAWGYGYCNSHGCYYSSHYYPQYSPHYDHHHPHYAPIFPSYRQCRGTYFDAHSSAWYEVDVLVPVEYAIVGTSTYAKVPRDGYIKVWITQVFKTPNVLPPKFTHSSLEAVEGKQESANALPATTEPLRNRLTVSVSSEAQVTINGRRTTSTGEERHFVSGALLPGARYAYDVTATYVRDGKSVTETRTVELLAGKSANLTFAGGEVQPANAQPADKALVASVSE